MAWRLNDPATWILTEETEANVTGPNASQLDTMGRSRFDTAPMLAAHAEPQTTYTTPPTDPTLRPNTPMPAYPAQSRKRKEAGVVRMKLCVEADGRVSKADLAETIAHVLPPPSTRSAANAPPAENSWTTSTVPSSEGMLLVASAGRSSTALAHRPTAGDSNPPSGGSGPAPATPT